MQINIKKGPLKTANRLFRQMTLPAVFGLLSLSAGQAWANSGVAGRFVQCTATVQGNGTFKGHPALVFGSQSNGINLLNNNQPEDIQATIHYQCTNRDLCKKALPPTTETQTQVFGHFLPPNTS